MPITATMATVTVATSAVGKGFGWCSGVSVGCSEGDRLGVEVFDGDGVGLVVGEGDGEGGGDQ
jgi:hypothetical protein